MSFKCKVCGRTVDDDEALSVKDQMAAALRLGGYPEAVVATIIDGEELSQVACLRCIHKVDGFNGLAKTMAENLNEKIKVALVTRGDGCHGK